MNKALAETFGLDEPRGALVASVETGGPADKAGVQRGDVILAIDGKAIDSAGQLPAAVAATDPGKAVAVQVWRDRATREVSVRAGPDDRG